MTDRLIDKIAVITGGTSGIGAATAELFVENGATVIFTGRSEEKGQALADRLGPNARYVRADVMSEADIKSVFDGVEAEFGKLDILFNNAGGPTRGAVDDVSVDAIRYAMQLLFESVVLGIRHAVPLLRKAGGGAIINNSSVAAIRDAQGDLLYSAAKAAVTHYTRLAGVRLGPDGIRCNTISPGAIATPIFWGGSARANTLTAEHNEKLMNKLQNNLASATPMQVPGLASDIANAALFLASDEGRFINSHDLVVDGGRTSLFIDPPGAG